MFRVTHKTFIHGISEFQSNSVTVRRLTGGLVLSKAPMAILKPDPSAIRTFSFGILTSSKVMPLVSEHLWPMFISYRHKTQGHVILSCGCQIIGLQPRSRLWDHPCLIYPYELEFNSIINKHLAKIINKLHR